MRPSQRILVIDDNRDAADTLTMLLELYGSTVNAAYGGAAGIEALRAFKPQFVFLDLGMPALDGFETARRIRASAEGQDVKLVALSAWGKEQVEERAQNVGFDCHLTKPASFEALCNLLWCEADCVKEQRTSPLSFRASATFFS
jgi:CheY-like chemotaxis protein